MFERYTEDARRTIFFARYEASQFGAPYIETEHLLLGLMRADSSIRGRFLPPEAYETMRKEVEARTTTYPTVSTSVDLPLSNESKRVLAYAAEEAERLRHWSIAPEHLLLGLLREKGSIAADLLKHHGVNIDAARQTVSETYVDRHGDKARHEHMEQIEIHHKLWNTSLVNPRIAALSQYAWRQQPWKPLDVLVEKDSGRLFFDLSLKNDPQFELRPGGLPEGECDICGWELDATAGPEHALAYTNGREWICTECYTKFFSSPASSSQAE